MAPRFPAPQREYRLLLAEEDLRLTLNLPNRRNRQYSRFFCGRHCSTSCCLVVTPPPFSFLPALLFASVAAGLPPPPTCSPFPSPPLPCPRHKRSLTPF